MIWHWNKHHDRREVEEADRRVSELEDRAKTIGRLVREQDPWTGQVLDTIRRPPGEPYAR